MRDNHLLVAAGGTGGHIYPAIAVAERFRQLVEDSRVTFVGTERGLESRIVPKAGFPLEFVRAAPLRGGSLRAKLKGVLGLFSGLIDSWKLLKNLKPSVVMGVGAYVSGTVLLAAALRGTPTLILEPNAEPGLANKWLAPFIDEAACAWEETTRYFGKKAIVTGNPVRQSIFDVPPLAGQNQQVQQEDVMRVLVFGGRLRMRGARFEPTFFPTSTTWPTLTLGAVSSSRARAQPRALSSPRVAARHCWCRFRSREGTRKRTPKCWLVRAQRDGSGNVT